MTHALDDHGVLGNAIKDEVGIRADQHAADACNVGLLSDMRMIDKERRDALHPLADATGTLRRFLRDGVDDSSICRTARLVKRSFTTPAWPKEPLFRHPSLT